MTYQTLQVITSTIATVLLLCSEVNRLTSVFCVAKKRDVRDRPVKSIYLCEGIELHLDPEL